MKKEEINKLAQDIFKKFPECKTAYIASDGNAFISENPANLHKNTKKGEKVTIIPVANENFGTEEKDTKDSKDTTKNTEKSLMALTKSDLQKMAEDLKIDMSELDTKQKITDAILTLEDKNQD